MDRKRKDYRQGRHEGYGDHDPYQGGYYGRDPYQGSYYDNGSYAPDVFWQGAGIRYPSTYRAPYVKEPPFGVFQPSSSNASTDSDLRTPSRKRKYMLIAIIVTAVLVIAAIVGAILAATLTSGSENAAQPKTVERIVEKAVQGEVKMNSKNWTDAYNDKNSVEYNTTANEFIQMMDEKLRNSENSEMSATYSRTVVEEMRKGSVIFVFVLFYETTIMVPEDNGSPTTTTGTPGGGEAVDPGPSFDIDIDLDFIMERIKEIPDLETPKVSDVNECESNPCNNGGTCVDGVNKFICTCAPGFTGDTCDEGIDECNSNPCQYNGVCEDKINGYTCTCVAGIAGDNCEINIDDCESDPCKNGGTCTDEVSDYTCGCMPGYTDKNCETNINECESNPCKNAGTCTDGINKYTCECKPGYTGDNCQIDINDCETDPCKNGGTCTDEVNDYTCDCMPGYTDKNCSTNINECESNPCENGGTCTDDINKYTCECEAGYTGDNCQTDIDECSSDPCVNGDCTDGVNEYTCSCQVGWTGINCDQNVNDCAGNPCKNGATCIDEVNSYRCTCVAGWTGPNCDSNINECASNPCENGACRDAVNSYTCDCDAGWTGKHCDENINECASNPCENGACRDAVNSYTCDCEAGWTGTHCDENIDDCQPNPCKNNADCTDRVDDYTCSCEAGWTGKDCDENIDDCAPNPCKNGACKDAVNGYTCDCVAGWTGKDCDENVDECGSNPCKHGGTCTDGVSGYSCNCEDGFKGDNCEINIDECEPNPCENGGTCIDGDNGYTCNCDEGWVGDNCETNFNDCDPNPCFNGGTCLDDVNGYKCECDLGWEGLLCKENTDDCQGNLCEHGSCIDEVNGYYCSCDEGWKGTFCNEDYNECQAESLCEHLSACQNTPGSFICVCNSGWAGQFCDINIDECQLNPSPCLNGATCTDNEGSYTCACSESWTGPICDTAKPTSTTSSTTSIWTEPSAEPTDEPSPKPTDEPGQEPTGEPHTERSTTTGAPCATGTPYRSEINGVILQPYDDDLDSSETELFRETEGELMDSFHNVTDMIGMTDMICDMHLQQFYPMPALAISELYVGFTIMIETLESVTNQTVQAIFYFMPNNTVFSSMRAMYSTTNLPPTTTKTTIKTITTTPPTNQTCSRETMKSIYLFNITYLQNFTNSLYDTSSQDFRDLNQTLSGIFMQSARNFSVGHLICNVSVVRCAPVVGNISLKVNHEATYISAQMLIYVPPYTLPIEDVAYLFYFAEGNSNIILNYYHVIFTPQTTTTVVPTTHSCSYNQFQCFNGTCIPYSLRCNGKINCADGSDELFCSSSTTSLPMTTTPHTGVNGTCNSHTLKSIYSFNITYLQEFTNDLYYNWTSDFMELNDTLTSTIMVYAQNYSHLICNISLVRCVPAVGFEAGNISAEVQLHVIHDTLDIYYVAYWFYQASAYSEMLFVNHYEEIYSTSSTTTTPFYTTPSCDYNTTPCADGSRCIPIGWLCDGDKDCYDGSDELHCLSTTRVVTTPTTTYPTTPSPNTCRPDQFECADDGRCLPGSYACDDYVDCYDRSDEAGCDCPEFRCNNGDCISYESICNGIYDCTDGSDERGCPVVCANNTFTCKVIKECVNISNVCDGKKNCKDGTDEWYNCSRPATPSQEYEIRLMDGYVDTTNESYGRVEIRLLVDGQPVGDFGTVCDDSWGTQEAIVLCRSLNASDPSNSFAYGGSAFGKGSGQIWLSNFHCYGNEDELQDCISSEWGQAHCSHQQDASISCGINRVSTPSTTSSTLGPRTTYPTLSTPSSTPMPGENIRLVDGENCLEGRIEVFYKGEWGTVCDDGFNYEEARVVCRSLGFWTYSSYYNLRFGYTSSLPIHMSYVYCPTGNESSIFDCQYSTPYCNHYEDQGIRCYGDPYIECKTGPDIPSVNCSFTEDRCAYNMTVISGSTNWRWTQADVAGMTHATNSSNSTGRLMIYRNTFGSEMESARMASPRFNTSSAEMKVEFYYQLQESSYNDLIFSLNEEKEAGEEEEEHLLWNSVHLRRDQEYQWLYECVQLSGLKETSNYSLVFTAKRGPSASSTVAADEILLTDGLCAESLLDGMCDFDRPRSCGMSVECVSCDRTKHSYTWMWQSNRTYSQIQKADGRFMVANSTFANEDDEAVISFAVPNLDDITAVNFMYQMNEEDGGKLEVLLYEKDRLHSTLLTQDGSYGDRWFGKCVQLPDDIDSTSSFKIAFKATHGKGLTGYIAIDNVKLMTSGCPHPVVTCAEELSQCGWKTNAGGPLYWKFFEDGSSVHTSNKNIRLVDGPDESSGAVEVYHNGLWGRVCDDLFGIQDAKVVCRQLGYPTDYVDYTSGSYYGYSNTKIWLDNLYCRGTEKSLEECSHPGWGYHDCSYYEHVGVQCYGDISGSGYDGFYKNYFELMGEGANTSAWASLSSRAFIHEGGEYRFMFDYIKTDHEVVQVWYSNRTQNETLILDKIIDPVDPVEQYCLDFPPEIYGEIALGLTAFKTTSGQVKTVVQNFALEHGSCTESLAKRDFTFESDHMLYGYEIESDGNDEDSCKPKYEWNRVLAGAGNGLDTDHTFGNESGHFMYVNPAFGESGNLTSLNFKQVTEEQSKGFCSLQFYYFISDTSLDGSLSLSVNSKTKELAGIPNLPIWLPGCVYLVDTCGEDPGLLDMHFSALNVEAGVDDIVLSTEPCPEREGSTVSCEFVNGDLCGYIMDPLIWSHNKGENLTSNTTEPGNYIVSPLFDLSTNSCVTISFASTANCTARVKVIGSNGQTVTTTDLLEVPYSTYRTINLNIPAGTQLRLFFEAYMTNVSYYVQAEFSVFNILVVNGSCSSPGLSCDENDLECDGECVASYFICDGIRQCEDGSDEKCECGRNTFNCTVSEECVTSSLQCDGFADCTDGSDEVNCGPDINCNFRGGPNWDCGYQLYNAHRNIYADGLQMSSRLAYITSPEVNITEDSCLTIDIGYSSQIKFRISSYDGEMYTILYQNTSYYGGFVIPVDIAPGYYKGVTTEIQSTRAFYTYEAVIKSIDLYDMTCQELITAFSTTPSWQRTTYPPWNTTYSTPSWQRTTYPPWNTTYSTSSWQRTTYPPWNTTYSTSSWQPTTYPPWNTTYSTPFSTPTTDSRTTGTTEERTTLPPWATTTTLVWTRTTTPWWYTTKTTTPKPTTIPWWNRTTTSGVWTPWGSSSKTSTTTQIPLPADFPQLYINNPDPVAFGGSLTLSCIVSHDPKYKLILSWFIGDTEISRQDDIMVGEEDQTKFKIIMNNHNIGVTYYNLTINDVTDVDASEYFICVADVIDYYPTNFLKDSTRIKIEADGCQTLGNSEIEMFCKSVGYRRVAVPTASGSQTMYQVSEAFYYLQYLLERTEAFGQHQCLNPLKELACGLHASQCQSGKLVKPVCREHCQEIADVCMEVPIAIVSNNNSDLHYYCKYLPSLTDSLDCTEIWLGCEVNMTLGTEETPTSVRLRSENHPSQAPSSSPCNYYIKASPYYILDLTVEDITLGDECSISYLMINEERVCSSNATQYLLSPDKSELNISLVSNSPDNAGFLLLVSQVLHPDVCDVIEVRDYFGTTYDGHKTGNDTCTEWIFYTEPEYSVWLSFSDIAGCLEIYDENSIRVQEEICSLQEKLNLNGMDVVKVKAKTPGTETAFSVIYSQNVTKGSFDFAIESVELREGVSDNIGKVFINRTDGKSGFVCGYMNRGAADVICRSAGHATPALGYMVYVPNPSDSNDYDSETKDIIMYELTCIGNEKSILECITQKWIDTCTGYVCSCYYGSSFRGVHCPVSTLSCSMTGQSNCGYEYDTTKVLLVNTIRNGDGLYMLGSEHDVTEISSPFFKYSEGESVTFDYSFGGYPGENLELSLRPADGADDIIVWQKPESILDGRYTACVTLPNGFVDKEVQMVFTMVMAPSVSGSNHTIGLHNVSIKQENCPDQFPANKCSFNDLEVCQTFLSETCKNGSSGTTVWNVKNNTLEGSSTYAKQDTDYAVTFSSSSGAGSYLRFNYLQTGVGVNGNDLELRVDFETSSDGVETIFSDNHYKSEWEDVCMRLPSTGDGQFSVKFILRRSVSEGRIFLDDIELNNEPCPHPISCDFERNCSYSSLPSQFAWQLTRTYYDHTFGGQRVGHVMQAATTSYYQPAVNGIPAVFSTPIAQLSKDIPYTCLSFYYYLNYGSNAHCKLEVIVSNPETNETTTTEIETFIPYLWQKANIKVDPDVYSAAQFSFLVTPIYGSVRIPVRIDDVELLPTDCIEGLQDIPLCDFSNPGLCGFEANCTVDSGFIWRIYSGNTSLQHASPRTDADGNVPGHSIYLDSSLGAAGHESHLWFNVDLANVEAAQYTFSYYMTGNGTGMLKTFYRSASTNTYSAMSVVPYKGSDFWIQSDCYELPQGFHGEIYLHATRGASAFTDIFVDNVEITKKNCPTPSVTCDFTNSNCGYTQKGSKWTLEDGYITTTIQGALRLPLHSINVTWWACISFDFESEEHNALIVEADYGSFTYRVYSNGRQRGQIEYNPDVAGMKFVVPDDYKVKLDNVTVTPGRCGAMACGSDEMACQLQCIPNAAKCDRVIDCNDALDESDCGFSLPCKFDGDGDDCGYATDEQSATEWSVVQSHTFNHDGKEENVTGGMLFTSLKGQYAWDTSSVSSTWNEIYEPSCVRFRYLGTVPSFTVTISNKDSGANVNLTDPNADMTPTSWRYGQISTEQGTIMISFITSLSATNYTRVADEEAFVAIDEIEVLDGACEDIDPPECPPAAPLQCDDRSLCYIEDRSCDRKIYCPSGSDESTETCAYEYTLACDFEDGSLCGYTIISNTYGQMWSRVGGYYYQIPPYDHTKQDESGSFLLFVNWDNDQSRYESTTATTPSVTFPEDGCISFWYILNGTAVQPTALSAQIMVSLNYIDTSETEFVFYDSVDRSFPDWTEARVPVRGNETVSGNFTAIISENFLAWPGVVALDDIVYVPGECRPTRVCNSRTFECKDTGVCIPQGLVCNGKKDCGDNSDEKNCISRPKGKFMLGSGDGTYGQVLYYLDRSWRHVCFPTSSSDIEDFNIIATQRICEQLGFIGRSESYEYKLRYTTTDPVSLNCNDTSCTDTYCSSYYSTTYAGVRCSNTACASGTVLCPGTADVCVPTGSLCDGNPQCPKNSDETDCCCLEGDSYCTRPLGEYEDEQCVKCTAKGMFECQNHQCISTDLICDGRNDCADGTDEYRCVHIDDGQVTVYYQSQRQRLPVCHDNIGRKEAESLCSASGSGLLGNRGIQRSYTKVDNGLMLAESSSTGGFLPGIEFGQDQTSCYPLILNCSLPECGTTSYIDDKISSFIYMADVAVLGEWPWHGSLRKYDDLHCGCTLLFGQWALTAAHCVESRTPSHYTATFGSVRSDSIGAYGQQFNVIDIQIHHLYNDYDVTKGYDVALLKLAFAPKIDNYTRPICLGTERTWQYILDQGDKAECYITGYGANELFFANGDNPEKDLGESRVDIVDKKTCRERYRLAGLTEDVVSHDGICAQNAKPYQAACYGDSGGSLVCRNEIGRWEQFGVASYGASYCKKFVPIIYFNVTTQREWIESETGIKLQDVYPPLYDDPLE